MRRMGNSYVDDFVCLDAGVFGIADEFYSIQRGNKLHVSLQTFITGYGFVVPRIRTNGQLIPLEGNVDKAITGRYPIYTNLDEAFIVVKVDGDLDTQTGIWSENTQVEFFSPDKTVSGADLASPQKGVIMFKRETRLGYTPVSCFMIGRKSLVLDSAVPLRNMILAVITPYVGSKKEFYLARTQ